MRLNRQKVKSFHPLQYIKREPLKLYSLLDWCSNVIFPLFQVVPQTSFGSWQWDRSSPAPVRRRLQDRHQHSKLRIRVRPRKALLQRVQVSYQGKHWIGKKPDKMNDLPGGLINEPFVRETPLYPSNILVSDPLSAFRAEKGPFNGPQPLISCDASGTTNILGYRQVQRT